KPYSTDFSVVRQQFAQLPIHEVQIGIPVSRVRPPGAMSCSPPREIVLRMPIELRMIQEQLNSLLVALRREHADHVFSIRRARHHVPVSQLRIEHRESVVML